MNNIQEIIAVCNDICNNDNFNQNTQDVASITSNILNIIDDFLYKHDISDVTYKEEYLMRNQYACEAAIETFVAILEEVGYYFDN